MANVSFGKGSLTLTGTTSSFPDGMIYFNTSSKKIYLNNGGTVVTFDGNNTNTDTKNTAGSSNTSSKIYLVGATSQAANPQTYSHDTAYVGTDGCLYSNSLRCSSEWTELNSSTGVPWTTFQNNTTYLKAQEIIVRITSAPIKLFCPSILSSSTETDLNVTLVLTRAADFGSWSGTSSKPNYILTGGPILQSSYSLNSTYVYIFGYMMCLYTDTSKDKHMSFYYQYIKATGTTFGGMGNATDWDTRSSSTADVRPYINVMAVRY